MQIGDAKLAVIEEKNDDVAATGMDNIRIVLKEPAKKKSDGGPSPPPSGVAEKR